MIYLISFFMSVMDHLITVYFIGHGAQECNPIMKPVMDLPFWTSFFIKNGWTGGLLAILFFIERNVPRVYNIVHVGKFTILTLYSLLMVYHLYGFLCVRSVL